MPNMIVQFKQRFEPFIKRFDGLATLFVDFFTLRTLIKLLPSYATTMGFITRFRFAVVLFFRATFVFRTKETSASTPSTIRLPFNPFSDVVAIVSTICRYMFGHFWKMINLFIECSRLLGIGRMRRRQQGENGAVLGSRYDDFKTVSLHPPIMFGAPPLAVLVTFELSRSST